MSHATFEVAKIHASLIKFHEKYFIESMPYDNINPDQTRPNPNPFKNKNKPNHFSKQKIQKFLSKRKKNDMKTGKLVLDMQDLMEQRRQKFYTPVLFCKLNGKIVGKVRPENNVRSL